MSALQREKEALQLECVGLQREQSELQRELRRMSEGSMEGRMEGSMGELGPSGHAGAAADPTPNPTPTPTPNLCSGAKRSAAAWVVAGYHPSAWPAPS